jgi:acyl-CoA synthetase (AMP-forming)/AMP-acid ligase II
MERTMTETEPSDPTGNCATLVELLQARAQRQPEKRALTFLRDGSEELGHLTYRAIDLHSRAIAAKLQELSRPGTRALLIYPQGLEYVTAFLGCLYAGIIAIPVFPPRPNQSLNRILSIVEDSSPAFFLCNSEVKHNIDKKYSSDPRFKKIPALATDNWLASTETTAGLAEKWQETGYAREGQSIAYLQYTSGSTATPKGVMVSHANLMRNLLDMDLGWEHSAGSVLVTWLPFFHDMGLIYGVLEPLFKGFPGYFMSPLTFLQRPIRWLQAISNVRATHSVAPNFAYDFCAQRIKPEDKKSLDLSCWRVAVNGAEPVRKDTLDRFARAFAECGFRQESFCPGYGLAEGTLKVTAVKNGHKPVFLFVDKAALEQGKVKPVTPDSSNSRPLVGCGSSMIDSKIVIVDPATGAARGPDQVGEIWLSGSTVTRGYWNRPEETAATFLNRLADGNGPFLRTGDMGFLMEGELYVTGRMKDMILIRGQNHYPQDIEISAENSHPALKRAGHCAAFSIEANGEERLVVVQEVERSDGLDLEDIMGAVRQAVAEEHDLQAYKVVLVRPGGVPRTSSGKVRRRACRDAWFAGELPLLCH